MDDNNNMPKLKEEQTAKEPQHNFKLINGHSMKFSFELDGVKYWEFTDTNMAPTIRMMNAFSFYEEFKMRCTREFLIAHCEAVEKTIDGSKGSINLLEFVKLHVNMRERLQWIFEPDSAYKYASVVMIDESEDPYNYDFRYNQEKIARWKKHNAAAFFLSLPIAKLFPPLNLSENDLQDYLKAIKKMDQSHLKTIFTHLSPEHQNKEWYHILALLKQEESV